MLTMLPSFCLISSKQTVSTVSSNQCLCCSTGLKVIEAKTKLQNVGAGDPLSTVLRICGDKCLYVGFVTYSLWAY